MSWVYSPVRLDFFFEHVAGLEVYHGSAFSLPGLDRVWAECLPLPPYRHISGRVPSWMLAHFSSGEPDPSSSTCVDDFACGQRRSNRLNPGVDLDLYPTRERPKTVFLRVECRRELRAE